MPEPPLVVSVRPVPNVPEVEVTVRAYWLAWEKVTVVATDEMAR